MDSTLADQHASRSSGDVRFTVEHGYRRRNVGTSVAIGSVAVALEEPLKSTVE
jgi:hypothetical protein